MKLGSPTPILPIKKIKKSKSKMTPLQNDPEQLSFLVCIHETNKHILKYMVKIIIDGKYKFKV